MREAVIKAMDNVYEEQPWEGYYFVRGNEIENLLIFFKLNRPEIVLEVGCGNGFIAHILSLISGKVIAMDLYSKNVQSHSTGIENAKRVFTKMDSKNIYIASCSVDRLSFKDDSFDMVFSSYVLHYLKDKTLALQELKRVVKKDGIIILIVPNFTERIYAFFQFYLYFLVKALKKVFIKTDEGWHSQRADSRNNQFSFSRLKENYRYFPFPGPHGAYKNSAIEMMRHFPWSWNQEFNKAGLRIVNSFTTTFTPYPLLLTVSLRLANMASLIFEPFTKILGNKPFVKYFGYSYCVILKK